MQRVIVMLKLKCTLRKLLSAYVCFVQLSSLINSGLVRDEARSSRERKRRNVSTLISITTIAATYKTLYVTVRSARRDK